VNAPTPVIAFVCTIEVADINMASLAIEAAGGVRALPKQAIPGVGWTAYFKDTESNIFGIYQNDPNAK
jgi:predicted enzyme related to lactoylglutathione lyase